MLKVGKHVGNWTSISLPQRTQSCNVWVHRGQLQSPVWLSINPASVFVFHDSKWSEAFFARISGRKRQEKVHCLLKAQGIRCVAVSKGRLLKADLNFVPLDNSVELSSSLMMKSWAFQRLWCWTGFLSSCLLRPSLGFNDGTVVRQWCSSWLLNSGLGML